MMSQHGEAAWAWVLSRPSAMRLLVHGEEAVAGVLVKHPGGICEPLIEKFGVPAVKALGTVGPQSGRRLAMMMADGELAQIGRTPELLGVVARHGDAAMDFIFKHRFLLAGGATLGAFLANPEPFLNGARDITKIAAENAIKPIADIPGEVAKEAAKGINWTLVFLVCLLVGVAAVVAFIAFLPWVQKLIALWVDGSLFGESTFSRVLASKLRRPVGSSPSSDKPRNLAPTVRGEDAAKERKGSMSYDLLLWLAAIVLPLCTICMAVALPAVVEIPTRKCHPDPNNQRKIYELQALRSSIAQHGILQPVGLRLDAAKDCHFAIWGSSRLLCAIDLGLETIPARVWERELTRLEIATFQAAENLARTDLRPSERAGSYRELMTLESLTVPDFAEKWSLSAATVWRYLTLLDQPADIVALVDQDLLPLSTVAALARLPDEESKRSLIVQIREGCLPRHKVEEAVQAVVGKRNGKPKSGRLSCKHGNISISVSGDGLTVQGTAEALQWMVKNLRKAVEQGQSLETLAKELRKGA